MDILQMHSAFKEAGYKLYPVGGAVRDTLLGMEPKDIDLATDAMPDKIIEILSDYNLTENDLQGKSFGVVRVRTKHFPAGIEIATFRQDLTSGRNPVVRVGATIEEDVNRRDFTINALFYDIDEKRVIDLVGGVSDLENKLIVTPGKAIDRFNEDGLRVIRAFRFAARIGGELSDSVVEAIATKQPKLESIDGTGMRVPIARERIWQEFGNGLLQARSPQKFVVSLLEHNIMEEILPGFSASSQSAVVIDSRQIEHVVAGLMLGRFSEAQTVSGRRSLISYLKNLKLTDDQAQGVVLLMRILGKDVTEVFDWYKTLNKTALKFADAAFFIKELGDLKFASALAQYAPSVKSADLQSEGFVDAALGAEQRRRETDLFNKLLEQC